MNTLLPGRYYHFQDNIIEKAGKHSSTKTPRQVISGIHGDKKEIEP
jgi:hypothetical protein